MPSAPGCSGVRFATVLRTGFAARHILIATPEAARLRHAANRLARAAPHRLQAKTHCAGLSLSGDSPLLGWHPSGSWQGGFAPLQNRITSRGDTEQNASHLSY
jgi:hypothetical protein